MAHVTIDMDQDGPENPLHGEQAYFDGSHLWCVGYKMLALFVYHPVRLHILRLTTMEVKGELTPEITLLWKLFNEVLSQITKSIPKQ